MRQNYLFYLRCLAILGQSITIGLVHFFLQLSLPLLPLIITLSVLVAANIHLAYYLKTHPNKDTDDFIAIQLTIDMLALATLLYFTGGAQNPFIFLFLLPLVIGAAMLPVGYTMALFLLSVFLFTRLMFDYVPLENISQKLPLAINGYVLAMWICFVLSAVLIVSFIAYLAYQVKHSQQKMAKIQEIQHRQEQILALGTLAAGTAHELGTPLATITVLAHELKSEVAESLKPDMELLCQQVNQCKQILTQMTQRIEQAKNQQFDLLSLSKLLELVLDKFQLLRPTIQIKHADFDVLTDILVATDATLEQAILNLLNNAADASPDYVELTAYIDSSRVYINVIDKGLGMSDEILTSLGQNRISTKGQQGMGIGLLLANATLERLGGEMNFTHRQGGGVVAQIVLPIYQRVIHVG
ncbi:MAG TPA: ATP-binding protein [Agitococcus sp.]|nr:ATP-binding protein [Agitococcus sp.]